MKQIYITIFALLLLPWQKVLGQTEPTDPYASDYKDYSVQVKPAKWHDLKTNSSWEVPTSLTAGSIGI